MNNNHINLQISSDLQIL